MKQIINPINNKTQFFLPVALIVFLISGCVTDMQNNPKQTLGKIVGAGVGALAGSNVGSGKGRLMAVAIGTLAGAWAGGELGKSLDAADQAYMQRSTQNSLEYSKTGVSSSWSNPDSGNAGTITPTETYQTKNGQFCREYKQSILIDGKEETAIGRACRQAGGQWKIVS